MKNSITVMFCISLLPLLLGGCTTINPMLFASAPTVAKAVSYQPKVEGEELVYWTVSLSWRCNAPAGGLFGSKCSGTTIAPDPSGTHLPINHIHCRTTTVFGKRDTNTRAGWRVSRGQDNGMAFYHYIEAESGTFAGGKEIEISYEHIVIAEKDKNALAGPLECTFTTQENW